MDDHAPFHPPWVGQLYRIVIQTLSRRSIQGCPISRVARCGISQLSPDPRPSKNRSPVEILFLRTGACAVEGSAVLSCGHKAFLVLQARLKSCLDKNHIEN